MRGCLEFGVRMCVRACVCVFGLGCGACARAGGYLWFVWLPGVGRVQFSEDPLVLGLERLLPVDVVYLGLPAPEHQDHGAGAHPWGTRKISRHSQL